MSFEPWGKPEVDAALAGEYGEQVQSEAVTWCAAHGIEVHFPGQETRQRMAVEESFAEERRLDKLTRETDRLENRLGRPLTKAERQEVVEEVAGREIPNLTEAHGERLANGIPLNMDFKGDKPSSDDWKAWMVEDLRKKGGVSGDDDAESEEAVIAPDESVEAS